jgi:hypothetical protein
MRSSWRAFCCACRYCARSAFGSTCSDGDNAGLGFYRSEGLVEAESDARTQLLVALLGENFVAGGDRFVLREDRAVEHRVDWKRRPERSVAAALG